MVPAPYHSSFTLTVRGSSAHGASPQLGRDALVALGSIVLLLQTVTSRTQDPLKPLRVAVKTVSAGKEYNIICDHAELRGDLSAWDEPSFKKAGSEMERIASDAARSLGCEAELTFAESGAERS